MGNALSPPGFQENVLFAPWEFSFIVHPKAVSLANLWSIRETKAQGHALTVRAGGSFTAAGQY